MLDNYIICEALLISKADNFILDNIASQLTVLSTILKTCIFNMNESSLTQLHDVCMYGCCSHIIEILVSNINIPAYTASGAFKLKYSIGYGLIYLAESLNLTNILISSINSDYYLIDKVTEFSLYNNIELFINYSLYKTTIFYTLFSSILFTTTVVWFFYKYMCLWKKLLLSFIYYIASHVIISYYPLLTVLQIPYVIDISLVTLLIISVSLFYFGYSRVCSPLVIVYIIVFVIVLNIFLYKCSNNVPIIGHFVNTYGFTGLLLYNCGLVTNNSDFAYTFISNNKIFINSYSLLHLT